MKKPTKKPSQDDRVFTLCRLALSGSKKTRMDVLQYAQSILRDKSTSPRLAKRLKVLVDEHSQGDMREEIIDAILRQEPRHPEALIAYCQDWVAIYVGGRKVCEGFHVDSEQVLSGLGYEVNGMEVDPGSKTYAEDARKAFPLYACDLVAKESE